MSNIAVTHADSGLIHAIVTRSERVSPHFVRLTLGGEDLRRFTWLGFDQWVRLAVPVADDTRFDNLPDTFGIGGYLKYKTLPGRTRPVIRSYTLRAYRPDPVEIDIDFVVHGTDGVAGPWAQSVEPGAEVAFIDQGCGWKPVPADWTLLAADESGLPALVGILRDMPRDAVGQAFVEVPDAADAQDVEAPAGIEVHWLTRAAGDKPGAAVLDAVRDLPFEGEPPYAFAVGERELATGVRRLLVNERGVPKQNVTFSGYWRIGKAAG